MEVAEDNGAEVEEDTRGGSEGQMGTGQATCRCPINRSEISVRHSIGLMHNIPASSTGSRDSSRGEDHNTSQAGYQAAKEG